MALACDGEVVRIWYGSVCEKWESSVCEILEKSVCEILEKSLCEILEKSVCAILEKSVCKIWREWACVCERCERNFFFSRFQMRLNPDRPMREPVHIEHREQMVDRRNHHKRQVHLHSHKPTADRTKRTLANVAVCAHRARASLTPAGERKRGGDARGENAAGAYLRPHIRPSTTSGILVEWFDPEGKGSRVRVPV